MGTAGGFTGRLAVPALPPLVRSADNPVIHVLFQTRDPRVESNTGHTRVRIELGKAAVRDRDRPCTLGDRDLGARQPPRNWIAAQLPQLWCEREVPATREHSSLVTLPCRVTSCPFTLTNEGNAMVRTFPVMFKDRPCELITLTD
jgi:hypothetical protein